MPFTALLYKEFRQQVSILITLFACTVLMQVFTTLTFSLQPNPPENWTRIMVLFNLSWVIVTVYAFGSAGSIFVAEHEEKTYSFLRGLPIRRGTLLAAKLSWVLLGTFSFALCLAAETYVFLLLTTFPTPSDFRRGIEHFSTIDGCYSVAIVFCNTIFAAIVWGLFWSARSRHQLFALLATFACAAATGILCKYFFFDTDYELAALLGVECIVLAFALYRAYFWFDRWVDRKQRSQAQEPGASAPGYVAHEKTIRGLTPPALARNSFVALTWHAVRQSGWLFAFAIVIGIICIVLQHIGKIYHNDEFLVWVNALALFAICVFCGSIFTADHRHNTIAMLGHRGVRPGKIWRSRITAFGSVYFLFVIVYFVFYMTFSRRPEACYFFVPIFTMPFCSGALISLLFRSPILAPCLTALMWVAIQFWAMIFMWASDAYFEAVLYWSTFPLLVGFLIASRLRIGDWLRERSVWRSRRPVVCLIVGPALLLLAAIPIIRIYSVPVVNYGYFIDQWELKRQLKVGEGVISWHASQHDVWQPIVSLEDFNNHVSDYRRIQQLNYKSSWRRPHNDTNLVQRLQDTLARYEGDGDQRRYAAKRKDFVTAEFATEAIAFLESMEKDRIPSVERVRAEYERSILYLQALVKHPKTFQSDSVRIAVSRYYRWLPWERIRAERLLENDFQIQSRFAERTDQAVFENKGDFESLLHSYSEDYLKARRAPWEIDGQFVRDGIAAPQNVYNAEMARRALIIQFTLLKFGLEKNRLPETLDELVESGILKELPTVPILGGPFQYDKDGASFSGGALVNLTLFKEWDKNRIDAVRKNLRRFFHIERFPQ